MGTSDLAERELIQGLIKLAAAFVHGARGNPKGIEKNLRGARARLAEGVAAGPSLGVDVPQLVDAIDRRLADTEHGADPISIPMRIPLSIPGPIARPIPGDSNPGS
jgi:hypothetical protein